MAIFVLTMSSSNDCCDTVHNPGKKWSQASICYASTSRGLYASIGDHDGSLSICSGKCSCCSDEEDQYMSGRPCLIIDSATKLNKSKWNKFKSYVKTHLKMKRMKVGNKFKRSKNQDENCTHENNEQSRPKVVDSCASSHRVKQ